MKHIKMILTFYDKSRFPSIILAIIATLSIFVCTMIIGQYCYLNYTKDLFVRSGLKNAVYFMPYSAVHSYEDDSERGQTLSAQITKLKGVKTVLTTKCFTFSYNGISNTAVLYNNYLIKAFNLNFSTGSWFNESRNSATGNYNAILGNTILSNIQTGENISIKLYDKKGNPYYLKTHINGKLKTPSYIPQFGTSGNIITTDDFLNQANVLLLKESPELDNMLKSNNNFFVYQNFFVVLNPNISGKDKSDCITYLKKLGTIATYDDIITNTNIAIESKLKSSFPIPLFFLFISTICLFSVSVLFIYKKFNEHSVYFLCGCSKRRSFIYMASGIGLISITAVLINIAILFNYQFLSTHKILNFGNVIIDNYSIGLILLYIAIALFLTIPIPFLTFKNLSPIETYRRLD